MFLVYYAASRGAVGTIGRASNPKFAQPPIRDCLHRFLVNPENIMGR